MTTTTDRLQRAEELLAALVNAKAIAGVRGQVAGWTGEGRPDGPYPRHRYELGAKLPATCCGEVFELDDAMQAARAFLAEPRTQQDAAAPGISLTQRLLALAAEPSIKEYTHMGSTHEVSYRHKSDTDIGHMVRMLTRHDLSHEAVVCAARDRILYLVARTETMCTELKRIAQDLRSGA